MGRCLQTLIFAFGLASAGCDGFTFEMAIDPQPEITEIRVDGRSIAVDRPQTIIDQSYGDYEDGRGADPTVIELYADGVLVVHGKVRPGSCAAICSSVPCNESPLVFERVLVDTRQDFDFDFTAYIALQCKHADGSGESAVI